MRPSSTRFFKTSPLLFILATTFLNSCVTPQPPQTSVSATPFIEDKPSIDVCFSPEGNCQPIILNLINNAKSEIRVQSYSFTSKDLAEALINAHHKGVNVKILFDRSQVTARYSQIRRMKEAGIECIVDPVPGIVHNKIMIIDNEIILTGSYNWTTAAEIRNA